MAPEELQALRDFLAGPASPADCAAAYRCDVRRLLDEVDRLRASSRRVTVAIDSAKGEAFASAIRRAKSVEALCDVRGGKKCPCPVCGRVSEALEKMAGAL